jgi:hypothetical protein
MSKGAHLLNRNRAVPPVANGSMHTDYNLLNDSLHVPLYQGQRYVYTIYARDDATTQSQVGLWADFNRNGVFEASEYLGGQNLGGSFTVPATVPLGPVRVLSSTGQLLHTQPLTARDRGTDLPLDLRAQPRGLYLVQLAGPTGIFSRKLLLE